ncbi:MAG: TRAP transporter permease, partial [Proteobacteria bacterium]|nr:TRAP transporter permease [Pseudomonadota bacterium]
WQGASLNKAMSHYYLTTEGVFGIALGVSTSMVFLFVLFGSLLEKAGAGNYFIRVAFALMGHMRAGPAKAAVVSSAITGMVSGSAIANVVTTGTFTIPLMRKVGFSAEKAGAVEVASSTNGQLTPPIMGAAAFLMIEYVGISYIEVITHAALPAFVAYVALIYIVHLEALKADIKGLPRRSPPNFIRNLMIFLLTFIGLAVLTAIVYFGLGWMKVAYGEATLWIASVLLMIAYIALLYYGCKFPDIDTSLEISELPDPAPTIKSGLYYLLPVVVLVWCLTVERLSPSLSAFYATVCMLVVILTQRPLKAVMRNSGEDVAACIRKGFSEMLEGMVSGARNMIGIGVATGAAGIIIGTVSLTGAHMIIGELVEFLSGGSLMIMLLLVAVMSLLLGMGLPTTANYIVVSSLMAPVIVIVGAQSGLVVPLVAAHMFVFYFGILADDTPPVGLAAFAAAAISGGDPIKTGIQGFMYDIRTALLPFMFIFNTDLLLIDVGPLQAVAVFAVAVVAMMGFAAATQGYFFARNKIWELPILLLVAFTLFRPGYWLDQIEAPYLQYRGAAVIEAAAGLPDGGELRVVVSGPDFDSGKITRTTFVPVLAAGVDGAERLAAAGLAVLVEDGVIKVEDPAFGSIYYEKLSREFDFYGDEPVQVLRAEIAADRMAKEWFFLPALVLLLLLILVQRRRATQPAF